MTILERFYRFVHKTNTCWLWTGGRDKDGYARFWWNGRTGRASRFIFEYTYGPLLAGEIPCHTCDNPTCVRDTHLTRGTQSDNIKDAVAKGHWRQGQHTQKAKGAANGNAALTADQVLAIRRRYRAGRAPSPSPVSLRGLALEYGVSKFCIQAIVKRQTWAHLEDSVTV